MPFVDWLVSGDTCTVDWSYSTIESVADVQTSNLSLVDPTPTNLNVNIESSDFLLDDIEHKVTVLA